MEQGPIGEVLEHPRHPYTALLTASAPSVRSEHRLSPAQLRPAPEREPWPDDEGCVFAPRCRFAGPECGDEPRPATVPETGQFHSVACHHATVWRDRLR